MRVAWSVPSIANLPVELLYETTFTVVSPASPPKVSVAAVPAADPPFKVPALALLVNLPIFHNQVFFCLS